MASESLLKPLGSVAKVRSGFAFKSTDMGAVGSPIIKIKNVVPPTVDILDCERVPEDVIANIPNVDRFALVEGDTLIAMTGATVGKVGKFPRATERYYLNQRVGKVHLTKPDEADYQYLYYILSQDIYVRQMLGAAGGSAQPNISGGQIEGLEIPLPPLPEQKAIARILGTLDDKIELNRRMNATLEAMARALFQSWFIDFDPVRRNAARAQNQPSTRPVGHPSPIGRRAGDEGAEGLDFDPVHAKAAARQASGMDATTAALFSSSFEDSALGKIPLDWRITTVGECCERIFSGGTPNTSTASYWNGDIPWLSSGETRSPFIIETEKTITTLGVEKSSTKLARAGCVVIASAGQGHTRGQTSLLTFNSYINQSVVALAANPKISSDLFLFFDLERRYDEFRQLSDSHSSRGSLTTKLLAGVKCIQPPPSVIAAFDKTVGPLVRQITANLHQSRTLATLRDTLLPKLLSGELAA